MIERLFRFFFPIFAIATTGILTYWFMKNQEDILPNEKIFTTKTNELTLSKKAKKIPVNTVSLQINKTTFFVEIAKTQIVRQKGLMFREKLAKDHGMFFVFDKSAIYDFWMPNVSFPLDIVWIDKSFKIVDIKTAPPCKEKLIANCPSYIPDNIAKYVLEVNANTFPGKIGDHISIELESQ